MRMGPEDLGESARMVSDAGAFIERAAHAAKPSVSSLGRIGAVVSAVRLGARLLPAGRRLFNRYPLLSALAVAGIVATLYLARSSRVSTRS